jgi:hypothetical protein
VAFVGIGLAGLVLGAASTLQQWHQMRHWQPVDAQLIDVVIEHSSDGQKRVTANYRYTIDGREHQGSRAAVPTALDNADTYNTRLASELTAALRENRRVSAWVDPADHRRAVLNRDMRWELLLGKLGLSLIAIVIGLVMVGASIGKSEQTGQPESVSKPWLSRREWASATISFDSWLSLWAIWAAALVWNILASLVWFRMTGYIASGKYLHLLLAVVPLIGWGLLFAAVQFTRGMLRFGKVSVVLDPYPGAIGGQVGGSVQLRLPYDYGHAFTVELTCLRTYLSGPSSKRSSVTERVWETRGYAFSAPSASGTRLDFCFDVPPDLPASEPSSEFHHHWKLELRADLPGRNLHRVCDLPVFPTAAQSSIRCGLSVEHPLATGAPWPARAGAKARGAAPSPQAGFRAGAILRPGNEGDARPRSASEVRHSARALPVTPECIARMRRDAPAALSRRAQCMAADEVVEVAQMMLAAVLSLAALWLWGAPADVLLLLLLAGAWIGIVGEWLKYILMRGAVEHELAESAADRFVWAIAAALRSGKAEIHESSLEETPPARGFVIDLVFGGFATVMIVVIAAAEGALRELHLDIGLRVLIGALLALQVGGILMMARRYRSDHGPKPAPQFAAGWRGSCLFLLMFALLFAQWAATDAWLHIALTVAHLGIFMLGGLGWYLGARVQPNETRWLREHMQDRHDQGTMAR